MGDIDRFNRKVEQLVKRYSDIEAHTKELILQRHAQSIRREAEKEQLEKWEENESE